MKKIGAFLGPVFSTIISIGVTFLYFAGLVHSYKQHSTKDFIASVCLPPFTVYRGAEMFWHKKENKDLNDGVKSAVYLIMSKPIDMDAKAQLDFSESKARFKNLIKNLDQSDLKYIKAATTAFVDFIASFQYDLISAVAELKQSKNFNFHQSEKSLALGKKCSSYGLEQEVVKFQNEIEQIESGFKKRMEVDSTTIDNALLDTDKMKIDIDKQIKETQSVYDDIFKID